MKLIEKLSRRHLINSFDVFFIKGFTVGNLNNMKQRQGLVERMLMDKNK